MTRTAPHPDDLDHDHLLPSTPATVVWGYLAPGLPAPLSIASGDIVRIETINPVGLPAPGDDVAGFLARHGLAREGALADALDIMAVVPKGEGPHILTGPVRLPAARVGDVLAVSVLAIAPRLPAFGVSYTRPGGGSLPNLVSEPWAHLQHFDLERGTARFNATIDIPLAPFMGTMGVAPTQRVSSIPPGPFGGNIDLKDLRPGTTLYLPVLVDGADFFVGDGHGAQGNGEVCLTGLESSLTGVFRFDLHPARGLRWPMAETPDDYIVMGLDPDLDEAATLAVRQAITILRWRTGVSEVEAYALASLLVDFEVTQIVDGVKGIHGRIPKRHFQGTLGDTAWWGPPP